MGLMSMNFNKKRLAFTLSEVMVTLSLIGFLATMTLSTVGSSIQQRARLAEFRTAYAKMETALRSVSSGEGKVFLCYAAPTTAEQSEFGMHLAGTAPAQTTGCKELEKAFVRALGATRFCETVDPLTGGCFPRNYPTNNNVAEDAGCFKDYTKSSAYVLDNSMIVFTNTKNGGLHLFAIDINGRKGPNKWGQDIFPFSIKYTETVKQVNSTRIFVTATGILPPTGCSIPDTAPSKSTATMMKDSAGIIVKK